MLPLFYQQHFEKYLSSSQLQTLKILIWLLQSHKQVKIEKLASYFPLPILYESRRKLIQRFLVLHKLSISLFWFPIITTIINLEFSSASRLILTIDRTNWKHNNLLMISQVGQKHGFFIYWQFLDKSKGSSNLREQQSVIRPVLRLLKKYKIVLIGDREFHSVELAYWLNNEYKNRQKRQVYFAFRQIKNTYIKLSDRHFQKLRDLELNPGQKIFFSDVKVTKEKQLSSFNLVGYWKRKYKKNHHKQPWYILTNLSKVEDVIQVYNQRSSIEALFKDQKTAGYNLEDSKANQQRLTNLVLLIAIAYTITALKGKKIKNKGKQKYIARLREKQRKERRHSDHWVGLYGAAWILAVEFCQNWIDNIMKINRNKIEFYQKGLKAFAIIQAV